MKNDSLNKKNMRVKNSGMFPESRSLSVAYNLEMLTFARRIQDGGSNLVVWNRHSATGVQDDNEKAMTNQDNNMWHRIGDCSFIVVRLWDQWHYQDNIALTAMKRVSDGNGGTSWVEDTARRTLARATANELLAQINILDAYIDRLKTATEKLKADRNEANTYFTDTEQMLRDTDHRFNGAVQDVGCDINNFNNRLDQLYNDIDNSFYDGVKTKPEFLSWLYDYIINNNDADWDKLLLNNGVLNGDALAALARREEHTALESRALAIVFRDLETYEDITLFLRLMADQAGEIDGHITWTYDQEKINQALHFLEIEERAIRRNLANMTLDTAEYRELEARHKLILDRMGVLAYVSGLNYTLTEETPSKGDGIRSTSYLHGPLLGDNVGPNLAFEYDDNRLFNRLTYNKMLTTTSTADTGFVDTASEVRETSVQISRPLTGADIVEAITEANANIFLTRYPEPNLFHTVVGAGAGELIPVLPTVVSSVESWRKAVQINEDMHYIFNSQRAANLANALNMTAHVVVHESGEKIVIFSESDRTSRSVAVMGEIIGEIRAEPEDERNERFPALGQIELPIPHGNVSANIPFFVELVYGPAGTENMGFPNNDDKEELRRGYREDVNGSSTLESEDSD